MVSVQTNITEEITEEFIPDYTSSADKIATNNDLLIQILIHLPIRSLIQFKCVSKHWFSLISNPHLSLLRYPYPSTPSGLFLHPNSSSINQIIPETDFIAFENETKSSNDNPLSVQVSFLGLSGINIFHSCNGLLSCFTENELDYDYHIYNPTTKKFITLPKLSNGVKREVWSMCLAFDPLKSPHYKVICVWATESSDWNFQIEIYSSETRNWRASGGIFFSEDTQFDAGVYWNGAINWINIWEDSLYFNIEEERLGKIPMRRIRDENYFDTPYRYFGTSRDHLHLIEICGPNKTQFSVYELRRDYSEWFVKFSVDFDELVIAFPEMILSYLRPVNWDYYAFSILSLVREENDDESFLVLHIPGKVINYNLRNRTFKKLCDIEGENGQPLKYGRWSEAFEYIESLASV